MHHLLDSLTQWVLIVFIQRIVIYPLDNTIQPLHNRSLISNQSEIEDLEMQQN